MFWSRRSKRISHGRTWSEPRCFGLGVKPYLAWSTWSKQRCFGRAGRNVSRMVELGRILDVLVAPVKTYPHGRTCSEPRSSRSCRSKHISLGRTWSEPRCFGLGFKPYLAWSTWSKQRCFGRAGRNVSRMVELGRILDALVSGSNCISLGRLGRNRDVLVAPVETYLAWSNLVGF